MARACHSGGDHGVQTAASLLPREGEGQEEGKRSRGGGRQTLGGPQTPPQNGGHLRQALSAPTGAERPPQPQPDRAPPPRFEVSAQAFRRGRCPPLVPLGGAEAPAPGARTESPHLKWRPRRSSGCSPCFASPQLRCSSTSRRARRTGRQAWSRRASPQARSRSVRNTAPAHTSWASRLTAAAAARSPLLPVQGHAAPPARSPGPAPLARHHSPPLRPHCNCAMRANKGATALYTADVTGRMGPRMQGTASLAGGGCSPPRRRSAAGPARSSGLADTRFGPAAASVGRAARPGARCAAPPGGGMCPGPEGVSSGTRRARLGCAGRASGAAAGCAPRFVR